MKFSIGLLIVFLGALATLSLFGTAEAATITKPVTPSVTFGDTLSLDFEDTTNVNWESISAGTTQTGTIQAVIGANTNWTLTVQATSGYTGTNELTDENHRIPSGYFKYTSTAGSPSPPCGSGISSAKQFEGSNQTDVWTGGTATSGCKVAITYHLEIPASQPAGTYTATHTYTLASA